MTPNHVHVSGIALKRSLADLAQVIFVIILLTFLFATLAYFIEEDGGRSEEKRTFASVFDALYWGSAGHLFTLWHLPWDICHSVYSMICKLVLNVWHLTPLPLNPCPAPQAHAHGTLNPWPLKPWHLRNNHDLDGRVRRHRSSDHRREVRGGSARSNGATAHRYTHASYNEQVR